MPNFEAKERETDLSADAKPGAKVPVAGANRTLCPTPHLIAS